MNGEMKECRRYSSDKTEESAREEEDVRAGEAHWARNRIDFCFCLFHASFA